MARYVAITSISHGQGQGPEKKYWRIGKGQVFAPEPIDMDKDTVDGLLERKVIREAEGDRDVGRQGEELKPAHVGERPAPQPRRRGRPPGSGRTTSAAEAIGGSTVGGSTVGGSTVGGRTRKIIAEPSNKARGARMIDAGNFQ